MIFEPGFLGTKAPLFMDIITIFFAVMPIILLISVSFAKAKNYKLHFASQAIALALALVITVFFEVCVRISGGFLEWSKNANVNYDFILTFLVIHIFIAILAVGGWLYLFISSYKRYKALGYEGFKNTNHKKIGLSIFLALTISSAMGVYIYYALFIN